MDDFGGDDYDMDGIADQQRRRIFYSAFDKRNRSAFRNTHLIVESVGNNEAQGSVGDPLSKLVGLSKLLIRVERVKVA